MNFHERQHGLESLDLIYVSKEAAIVFNLACAFLFSLMLVTQSTWLIVLICYFWSIQ